MPAGKKISALLVKTPLDGTEEVPLAIGTSDNKRTTTQAIADLGSGGVTFPLTAPDDAIAINGSDATSGFAFDAAGLPGLAITGGTSAFMTQSAGIRDQSPGLQIEYTNQFSGLAVSPATGTDGESWIELNGYGVNNPPFLALYYSRGTRGSEAYPQDGDPLGEIYFGTNLAGTSAMIYAEAEQNFDLTHQGTGIYAFTINNAQTGAIRWQIDGSGNTNILNGGLVVGTPTGGSQGAGTVNASGYFDDGVPLGTAAFTAATAYATSTQGTKADTALQPSNGAITASAGAATLNTSAGEVTSEALVGAVSYTLTLTNSKVLATSTVIAIAVNSANLPVTVNTITENNGNVVILVGMAALTGTVVIRFAVFN